MAEVTAFDVKTAFSRNVALSKMSEELLERCASLCNTYRCSPKEMSNEYEALAMADTDNTGNVFTIASFGKLEHMMEQKRKVAMAAKQKSTPTASGKRASFTTPGGGLDSSGKKRKGDSSISPAVSSTNASPDGRMSQGDRITSYSMRTNNGQLVASLNSGLGARGMFQRSTQEPLGMRCRINTEPDGFHNVQSRYRYMYTELEERAAALDRHLNTIEADISKKIAVEEVAPIGIPSQDTVWVCGRVCNETSEGKMNKTSVVLEGSRRSSAGRTVHLDLSDAPSYALFPGQIVMAEGVSANGRRLNVKQLIEGVPRPMPSTTPEQLLEFNYSSSHQNGKAVNVVCATGPFTTSDSLDFQPLQDLLVAMLGTNPDVVVLMGPFVDIAHPLVKDGDIEIADDEGTVECYSFERLFVEKVCGNLQAFFAEDQETPTNFVLIPALGDAYHENVYPQPPFGDRDLVHSDLFDEKLGKLQLPHCKKGSMRQRVHLLPNPCTFSINEVMFGCTSHDALFALSSEEISANVPGDRLARLASHFIRQQSFFPMFPVPANSSVQLDLRHSKNWTMEKTPDVLLLPSRLTPMAKNVNGALVVNPGTLTKGAAGGTYATLDIHPLDQDKLRDAVLKAPTEALPHCVEQRTAVKIVRI